MSARSAEPASQGHFEPVPAGRAEGGSPVQNGALSPDRRLLELADQCVMCGLCLPHCPTYRISLDEAESPRGRIALARALTTGRAEPGPTALTHLDQCLACVSCQKVCPSGVQYDEIIVRTRAAMASRRARPDAVQRLLRDPTRLTWLARMGVAVGARRWLPALARVLPTRSHWRALAESLPNLPVSPAWPAARKPSVPRGRVALFRGCVASVYDRDTHAAAEHLLTALGYEVRIPDGAPCCGALARHAGDVEAAARHAQAARAAIEATGSDVALVSASGCFGDLRDEAMPAARARVLDVHAFIAADERFAALSFRPLPIRAALHLPCTQVNVVGALASIRALLARIPALQVLELPEQPRCCGAAGNYFIEHPEIARRLRDEKLEQAGQQQPDLVLTTNIGCRIHLGNGLRERGREIPVVHPLALLAQQLENGEL